MREIIMKYYIGMDLGGIDIKVSVINEDYKLVVKHVIPTQPHRSVEEIISDMADAGRNAAKKAGLNENDIEYVGVGIPGTFDEKTTEIVFANNLGWRNIFFIPIFRECWDIPVYLGNDADAAALAEVYAGAARGYDNVIVLTIGTGIGGGFVFDKKIFTGGGQGTEPGHIIIVKDGEPCTCGAKGCFETYASIPGLIREAVSVMEEHPDSILHALCGGDFTNLSGRVIFDAVKRNDPAAKIVLERYTSYLGTGIASLCNALRPQVFIIGGGISNAGDLLLDPVRKAVETLVPFTDNGKIPPILKAELGNDAGMIGAALFGMSEKQH